MDLGGPSRPGNGREIDAYIERVADIPLLTDDEESQLRDRLASEDQPAREAATKRLIESQLRLVLSLAGRYQDSGLPFVELVQAGNEGLIRGMERFSVGKPYRFSSWSTWWIRQGITRVIAERGGSKGSGG